MAATSSAQRPAPIRRRRSRGLIASGGSSGPHAAAGGTANGPTPPGRGEGGGGPAGGDHGVSSPPPPDAGGSSGNPNGTAAPSSDGATSPPDVPAPSLSLPDPCCYSRLAAAAARNAAAMGVPTRHGLCPPGRAGREVLADERRSRSRRPRRRPSGGGGSGEGALGRHEAAREAYLSSPPGRGDGEEYSSGDDDELERRPPHPGGPRPQHEGLAGGSSSSEAYFVPTPPEHSSAGHGSGQGLSASGTPGGPNGRLPFNYRKIRWFDQAGAAERKAARGFLKGEVARAGRLRGEAVSDHLRRAGERLRRRRGRTPAMTRRGEGGTGDGEDAPMDEADDEALPPVDLEGERRSLDTAFDRFPPPEMTPAMSAALVLESLSINPRESLEGLGKCYDGIVSAGTALLDVQARAAPGDAGGAADAASDRYGGPRGAGDALTASGIMSALSPLLITTLEESSGDALVALSDLRDMCGTSRYRRRFVQRIAPLLVRPPDSAAWSVRHQGDMAAVVAAVEMILDAAPAVFRDGWHGRGRAMLRDTERSDQLRTAASRLRAAGGRDGSDGARDGPLVGLSPGIRCVGVRCPHGPARRDAAAAVAGGGGGGGTAVPGPWGGGAVDEAVRQSVRDVLGRDWSRLGTLLGASSSPRDDGAPGSRRASERNSGSSGPASSGRPGISSAKSKEWDGGIKSPRAARTIPLSPRPKEGGPGHHHQQHHTPSSSSSSSGVSADALESAFGPDFASLQRVGSDENDCPSATTDPLSPPRRGHHHAAGGGGVAPKTPPTSAVFRAAAGDDGPVPSMPTSGDRARAHSPEPGSPYGRGHHLSAPLSPAHSAASVRSSGSAGSSLGAGSSVGGGLHVLSSATGGAQTSQYRALTSTPAERKRTVAACRALRAQITQFEEAFARMHGRPPKGQSERAPLASTYMQYREWKRAIRSDAACRIQALCRGALARKADARHGDPELGRFLRRRARERGDGGGAGGGAVRLQQQRTRLDHIKLPMDIDEVDAGGHVAGPGTKMLPTRPVVVEDGVEVPFPPTRASPGPPPSGPQHHDVPGGVGPGTAAATTAPPSSGGGSSGTSSGRRSSRSSSSLPDVSVMSLSELQQRKRELKQQLKLYDMNFHKQHGRMPEKREKEPIRHLYESYNAYKNQISRIERGECGPGPGTAAFRGGPDGGGASPAPSASSSRGSAPSSASAGGGPSADGGGRVAQQPQQHHGGGASSSSSSSMPQHHHGSPVHDARGGGPPSPEAQDAVPSPVHDDGLVGGLGGVGGQDLASLKAEKATLHQTLRSYEKDFHRRHGRQVSSFADIRPVAGQYRRYKEIKRAISAAQGI